MLSREGRVDTVREKVLIPVHGHLLKARRKFLVERSNELQRLLRCAQSLAHMLSCSPVLGLRRP